MGCMNINKKKYMAPRMEPMYMGGHLYLLSVSNPDDAEQGEYDDEFGLNINGGSNRHV